ncbi:extensin family protein [Azospirillum sp. RWY-5-1]|uniref:Extensin family protein n=1 Tax=Azospirillum oleiclasticum TaxID=2735135 RepID=A0ABX2T9D4_9PROT|nr:extensin family protein [Azospirillum oleiclasticum]NYZ12648.1 extensin family protein [Azospirillum oleiclasticum]NYZ19808.1 extensin family protein [Azospirillum oleiclasticum]
MGRLLRWVSLLVLAGLAVLAPLVWQGVIVLPEAYDPWAPLRIDAEPGLLTRHKLHRLEEDGVLCRLVLHGAGQPFTPVPDRQTAEGCGFTDAVRVERTGVRFNDGVTATCAVAAAWLLFERHALQPAAEAHFGSRVVGVRHLGTYSCRNLYGRAEGRRSEHATGNAIDIAGFTLADGTRIALPADWDSADPRKAAFLRDARNGACRFFDVVLGPDYNAAHRDHFHLDMGRFRACR